MHANGYTVRTKRIKVFEIFSLAKLDLSSDYKFVT